MYDKTISVVYCDENGKLLTKTLSGSRVGYDPVGQFLVKIWADRETFIVKQAAVVNIHMQD